MYVYMYVYMYAVYLQFQQLCNYNSEGIINWIIHSVIMKCSNRLSFFIITGNTIMTVK